MREMLLSSPAVSFVVELSFEAVERLNPCALFNSWSVSEAACVLLFCSCVPELCETADCCVLIPEACVLLESELLEACVLCVPVLSLPAGWLSAVSVPEAAASAVTETSEPEVSSASVPSS